MLLIKRVYEDAAEADGLRILVDRLWPRGVTKERAHLYLWMKEIAPSDALRKSFHQDITKWGAFEAAYILELKQNPAAENLSELVKNNQVITLLYAANNQERNHALVLKAFMEAQ